MPDSHGCSIRCSFDYILGFLWEIFSSYGDVPCACAGKGSGRANNLITICS